MVASRLTCSGAPVGVSISTQRRMPSRIVAASKALGDGARCIRLPTSETGHCHSRTARETRVVKSPVPSTLVRSLARGDLFDQFDDAAPKFGIGDAREGTRQRQALGSRQKIGNIGRRSSFAKTA